MNIRPNSVWSMSLFTFLLESTESSGGFTAYNLRISGQREKIRNMHLLIGSSIILSGRIVYDSQNNVF